MATMTTRAKKKDKVSLCCEVPLTKDKWDRTTCSECEQELSPCCGAAVTVAYDGALSCKLCWGEVCW